VTIYHHTLLHVQTHLNAPHSPRWSLMPRTVGATTGSTTPSLQSKVLLHHGIRFVEMQTGIVVRVSVIFLAPDTVTLQYSWPDPSYNHVRAILTRVLVCAIVQLAFWWPLCFTYGVQHYIQHQQSSAPSCTRLLGRVVAVTSLPRSNV
jgi:hypothetical protein